MKCNYIIIIIFKVLWSLIREGLVMEKKMEVAVLMATYNGEGYLKEQLDSLLGQSYQNFVIYIHDDGSTDKTREICMEYCQKYPNKIVMLDYPSTGGAKTNFFSFLEYVTADYYFFCDQDDVWLPDKILLTLNKAKNVSQNKNGVLVFTDLKVVDKEKNVIFESFFEYTHVKPNKIDYKYVLVSGFIPGCVMMIDHTLLQYVKSYKNVKNLKMHDWWILEVAYMCESTILFVNRSLMLYRQHGNNTIGINDKNILKRIQYNLNQLISGELSLEKKTFKQSPRVQASELQFLKQANSERLAFAKEFSEIGEYNKLKRIVFYLKNFHHVYRLWWIVLWC